METIVIVVGVVALLGILYYLTKDKDGDGKLTAEEVKANAADLTAGVKDTLDLNKDGKVDLADAALAARTVKTAAKAAKTTAKSTVTKARNRRKKKSA
jgi:uncharacterized membrane protein YgaE (UPF0421/DUF939 family)